MKSRINLFLILIAICRHVAAAEFQVSTSGADTNPGSSVKPFKTISAAARVAQAGDTITVHAGTYRERIHPPRGGESDGKRITYQAAPGEQVEIKGSEVVTDWVKVKADVWKAVRPNSFFGAFNPYCDLIHGDWFNRKNRDHHTGAVYLNGDWLIESASLDNVLHLTGTNALWFAAVDATNTTIWAQFKGVNPNEQLAEINVRQTIFYPDRPGCNFSTVRGFTMRDAATPWSPPTAEQIGLIGTHWSKGWIIESNIISHSICAGIALGKYGDEFDNTSANTAQGYVKTIERALTNGWSRKNIGGHIVRNNTVSHCEQAGIVGSLGAVFSEITGNHIHDIHVRRLFTGAEMAGIKIHAAIDVLIKNNRIHDTVRGVWLDWMAQGTRVTGNLCYRNESEDLFMEVNHGPFTVDNNLFLSAVSLKDWSEGGAYAHNLMAGQIATKSSERATPWHAAHSTKIAGLASIKGGDDRFYNNLFIGGVAPADTSATSGTPSDPKAKATAGFGLCAYDTCKFPLQTGGNVFLNGARPYAKESKPRTLAGNNSELNVVEKDERVEVYLTMDASMSNAATRLVTGKLLGRARTPNLPYENPDGSAVKIATDYFDRTRSKSNPTPGPVETRGSGRQKFEVW